MFKSLTNGRRNSRGSKGIRRVTPVGQGIGSGPTDLSRRMRPAFLPDDPETQGQDYSGPRISEISGGSGGFTGSNIT